MHKPIRIIIADDHPIFRRGLKAVLDAHTTLAVLADLDNGSTALSAIREFVPDVAVLDVDMPSPDGLEILRIIQSESLPVKVVFLTMHNDERLFSAALDAGARGFIVKDGAVNEIVDCISAVAQGKVFFSPSLSHVLLRRHERQRTLTQSMPALEALTPSERRVLKLVAESKTRSEIADELFISVRTVDHHRANISAKLGLAGRNALIAFAVEHRSEL